MDRQDFFHGPSKKSKRTALSNIASAPALDSIWRMWNQKASSLFQKGFGFSFWISYTEMYGNYPPLVEIMLKLRQNQLPNRLG